MVGPRLKAVGEKRIIHHFGAAGVLAPPAVADGQGAGAGLGLASAAFVEDGSGVLALWIIAITCRCRPVSAYNGHEYLEKGKRMRIEQAVLIISSIAVVLDRELRIFSVGSQSAKRFELL